jgi:hypothetical protein
MRPEINPPIPGVWDSTIRGDYASCHTKGFWSFQRKLGPIEASTDLIAGGAFAKGLEVARKLFYNLNSDHKGDLAESVRRGMLAAIEEYGTHVAPDHKSQKSVERVIGALADYFEHYPPLSDHVQPYMINGEACAEFTFSIPLPISHPETGEPILYAGRFDMLGVRNGQLVVVDEKTTSQLGPTWTNKWNLRGQFTGYIWACQQYGYPVLGAIVRGVSFLKNSYGHAESPQLRAQWQINQWYDQLLHDIDRAARAYKEGWYDQDFNDTCAEYGGCPFQTLCTAHNPEDWISKFATRDWDPLKKVPYVQPEQRVETVQLPEGVI